jgi:hypothetical protein
MFDDELDVFYDTADFALACTRLRPGEPAVAFAGVLAVVDVDQFSGEATLGRTTLQYPTAAVNLQPQDVLRTVRTSEAGVAQAAQVWRVLRTPERMVDGAESVAYLKPDPDA